MTVTNTKAYDSLVTEHTSVIYCYISLLFLINVISVHTVMVSVKKIVKQYEKSENLNLILE